MIIKLWAALMDETVTATVEKDKITINGEVFDFTPLEEGFRLPASAVGSPFFMSGSTDFVERVDGIIHVTLKLPVTMDSPEEYRNPETPIYLDVSKGLVPFPDTAPPVIPESELLPIIPEEPENGGLDSVTED